MKCFKSVVYVTSEKVSFSIVNRVFSINLSTNSMNSLNWVYSDVSFKVSRSPQNKMQGTQISRLKLWHDIIK